MAIHVLSFQLFLKSDFFEPFSGCTCTTVMHVMTLGQMNLVNLLLNVHRPCIKRCTPAAIPCRLKAALFTDQNTWHLAFNYVTCMVSSNMRRQYSCRQLILFLVHSSASQQTSIECKGRAELESSLSIVSVRVWRAWCLRGVK